MAEKGTISGDTLKFLLVNHAEPIEDLYELAIHGTKNVTLVELLDKVGKDIGKSTRWSMMQDMSRVKVEVNTQSKALEVTKEGLIVEAGGESKLLKADTIVMAVGSKSKNPLQSIVEGKGIPFAVVGDAQSIGLAFSAVHQGFDAGRSI